jgi:arabinose-5-phosphate isomerase
MTSSRSETPCESIGDVRSLEIARKVLEVEAKAILAMKERIGPEFSQAVAMLYRCEGKVLVSGVGKSGYVGRKIASTMASTGTPSLFIHPAEGIHGDLGMASQTDVFLFVSNSGETQEVLGLIPYIRRLGCPIVSMTGRRDSTLARNSNVVLPVGVLEEACPLGLAPTASTTLAMAVGDALAAALLEMRGFTRMDFARLHPGGTLGRRLLLTVRDLMHAGDAIPVISELASMRETIFEMTSKRLGVTGVVNGLGELVGVITDGDLRRGLERGNDMLEEKAGAVMTLGPKWIQQDALAVDALNKMQRHAITSLFVFSSTESRKLSGIVHLHDLLKAGVV